jgi:xanthine dehydrogenase YagR molybdenum-binding subunit
MRGPAEVPGLFALETAMDELAERLGMDPVELRRRNNADVFPGTSVPWSSKRLDECLEIGVKHFGWGERAATPATRLHGDDHVGMGMAVTAFRAVQVTPVAVSATMHSDGSAEIATSAVDLGTGMTTVIAMTAADALQVPIERISVRHGDSSLPSGGAAIGSSGTASVAPAVQAAIRAAMMDLRTLAVADPESPLYAHPLDDITIDGGTLLSGATATTFAEVLKSIGLPTWTGFGHTEPRAAIDNGYAHWSFGAHFCEVRVNRWTRETRVSRMLGVLDIGRVVNAKTARSQVMGGMIWGLSTALFEGLEFDSRGVMANASLADYLVPVNADVPEVEVLLLDVPDLTHNELGVRGAGEIGAAGVSAAIGNAIYNAIGIRLRELPMSVDKMFGDVFARD